MVASLCLTFNWSSILLVTSTFLFLLRMKSILVANKHNVLFIHISSFPFFAHLTDSSIMYFPLLTHPSHPTLAWKLLFLMTSIYARAAAHSKNRIVILTINLSRSLQMSESIWCMDTVNCQEGTYMYDNVEDSGLRMRKRLSCTVKPPNRGHFGDGPFVPCREVVLFLEVLF